MTTADEARRLYADGYGGMRDIAVKLGITLQRTQSAIEPKKRISSDKKYYDKLLAQKRALKLKRALKMRATIITIAGKPVSRDTQIKMMRDAGAQFREIGRFYGFSHQYVHQVWKAKTKDMGLGQ